MFCLHSFPRAILHIDGDSFFASCEVAKNPSLRGKPVVTGRERGIASALTYEAKALGIKRGMSIGEIKRVCPQAIILPSDYETYSLYSKRMFSIVRRYTSEVEEYSIDECFADLTGLRRPLNMSYEAMAQNIKKELDIELGMTFSVGLAPTKVLGKVASKWKKPDGLTFIQGMEIEKFLYSLPVEKIWGIGLQTSNYLSKCGIKTALEYANRPYEWIDEHMSKPYKEIWHELRGTSIYKIDPKVKHLYKSISKTRTFTPPTRKKEIVFSELSKNIENACIKARRHSLCASKIFFYLKTQDFKYRGLEISLVGSTNIPQEILPIVRENFSKVFADTSLYRATGIILMDLKENIIQQQDLFGSHVKSQAISKVYDSVDHLDEKFGKHAVFLCSSLISLKHGQHQGNRGEASERRNNLFIGENERQRLGLPFLGNVF